MSRIAHNYSPQFKGDIGKPPKETDGGAGYMKWLHDLPCCVSGQIGVVAHHVRLQRTQSGTLKSTKRAGKRPSDWQCVPLTPRLHDNHPGSLHKHSVSEAEWWEEKRIDPLLLIGLLNVVYREAGGNEDMARVFINQFGGSNE